MTRFELPDELSAAAPAEARGLARDEVRLLVVDPDRIEHARFRDIGRFLEAGDLLVVNTSGTVNAALDALRADGGPVVVHFSSPLEDGTWVVELRTAPRAAKPVLDAAPGEILRLPRGTTLTLDTQYPSQEANVLPHRGTRLWRARIGGGQITRLLAREGRPITYGYISGRWPAAFYQTVFANEPGSAEMPSAARPFTTELVTRLVSSGIAIAPIVLHTGVSSQEFGEPPIAERFRVAAATANLVDWTRRAGGRVIAVGTTVVRALESAAVRDGSIAPARGWTDLVLSSDHPARVVNGLVTGMHTPDASHLLLLEAVVGPGMVQRAYDAALEHRYLWHEFGDLTLLLPEREG
ncbi:MAG: S-adenosylmethionine:tRNA ribosyltransferase-isomerase [Actinomycetota bacterium]